MSTWLARLPRARPGDGVHDRPDTWTIAVEAESAQEAAEQAVAQFDDQIHLPIANANSPVRIEVRREGGNGWQRFTAEERFVVEPETDDE